MVGVKVVTAKATMRGGLWGVVWLCMFLCLGKRAEGADHPAFQPVKELFAAMSAHDGNAMHETATADFQLLEHGEDWSMQDLVEAVQPKGKPYQRKNYFSQIRARQRGDVAWLSYWNKAEISREGSVRTVVWLESAVVVKAGDRWKIQLLHSTRLAPDGHPKDIDWVQYEPSR